MLNYKIFAVTLALTLILSSVVIDFSFAKKPSVPDKVTELSAIALSASQISLSWNEPNDGGSPITGYQIERKTGEPWAVIVTNTASTDTTYSDTGLEADTKYMYRVSAINTEGIGHASNPASATTQEGILMVPSPPTNLELVSGNQAITLSWNQPDSDGSSPIIDYIIEYSSDNGASWIVYDDGISIQTSAVVSNLQNNHYYLFRVFAKNIIGTSPPSQQIGGMPVGLDSALSSSRVPPKVKGIGFYTIKTANIDNPYSEKILNAEQNTKTFSFGQFFPYSSHSDKTDKENYGSGYEKRGFYYVIDDKSHTVLIAKIDQPIQLQVRLEDNFASTKIEHLSFFSDFRDNTSDTKFSNLEIIFEKGKPLQVKDTNSLIKDAKVSSSLENGSLWIIFDLVFQKPMKKSDIIFQAWHEQKIPSYSKVLTAWEIIDPNNVKPELEQVSLTAEVEISHDTSSPVCKVDKICYLPFNSNVLEGGIVTWTNTDSFIHEVASGTPETGEDHRFESYIMPGKTFQYQFNKAGIYKYFCEIHPWANGIVTVYEKNNIVSAIQYDETKPPILVATATSAGSLMVENNDVVVSKNKDLRVEISGNVQEAKKVKSVSIIINRPDKTSDRLNVSVNERGYYFIPTVLDKKWQEGVYEVIAKFQEKEIGRVTFTITSGN